MIKTTKRLSNYISNLQGTSLGFAALDGREADYMDSLKRSIEYCKALDCKRYPSVANLINILRS